MIDLDAIQWAFLHFYYMDKANACMHCAPVKFSPLTFRLLDALAGLWPEDEDWSQMMAEVRDHRGSYDPDPGR